MGTFASLLSARRIRQIWMPLRCGIIMSNIIKSGWKVRALEMLAVASLTNGCGQVPAHCSQLCLCCLEPLVYSAIDLALHADTKEPG